MSEAILLDTHAAIWISNDIEQLRTDAKAAVSAAASSNRIHISPITGWEVATLVVKQRIVLTMSVESWFNRLLELEGAALAQMPPRVLMASVTLPGSPPNDPADRILAATAREYDFTLVTRDRQLLAYADAGHLRAVLC